MPPTPFISHLPPKSDGIAVKERDIPVSPHLLDLSDGDESSTAKGITVAHDEIRVMPFVTQGWLARIQRYLDDKIHLHDLRQRTVSVQPHTRQEFPHVHAKTMGHAVRMAVTRFFDEHPLAELTVLRTLHLLVLTTAHLVTWPYRALTVVKPLATIAEADGTEVKNQAIPAVMPFFMTVVPDPEGAARAAARAEQSIKDVAAAASPITAIKNALSEAAPETVAATAPVIESKPVVAPFLPTRQQFRLDYNLCWRKSFFGFASIVFLLVLPFSVYGYYDALIGSKDSVIVNSAAAVEFLKAAGQAAKNQDFAGANMAFSRAKDGFTGAKQQLGALAKMLDAAAAIMPGTQVGAAAPLLNAGREIADGGAQLSAGLLALQQSTSPTDKITIFKGYLAAALPHVQQANRDIGSVSADSLPLEYREYVTAAQAQLPLLTGALKKAGDVAEVMGPLLGQDRPKRYLVIFQNNAELRPTGGFMGSFALIDVSKGKVTNMEIPGGGTYDLKGQLTAKLRSPQPLRLINARWQFQDSNWFADFPTSAKQVDWFYDKAGGPTTDGVIAMTATFMEKLLAITGPIEMPEYGKTISAQNFYFETQKAVEVEYDKTDNKPKQFISDLAPKALERLMNADQSSFMALAAMLDDSLAQKEIQLWMKDADTQQRLGALGWTGQMKMTDGDFLYLVHSNIAGQKTDLAMKDDVQHAVKVLPDGTGIVTLTISRTHTGQKGAMFSGVRNVDYLRVYVPRGSALVEAHGFQQPDPKLFKLADLDYGDDPLIAAQDETTKYDRQSATRIFEESGKTVFGNWVQTDPGQTSVVTLVYQLPAGTIPLRRVQHDGLNGLYDKLRGGGERDALSYTLLLQKQPGANPLHFTSSIDLPRGFTPTWQEPIRAMDDRQRWLVTKTVDRDTFIGTIAESP